MNFRAKNNISRTLEKQQIKIDENVACFHDCSHVVRHKKCDDVIEATANGSKHVIHMFGSRTDISDNGRKAKGY